MRALAILALVLWASAAAAGERFEAQLTPVPGSIGALKAAGP